MHFPIEKECSKMNFFITYGTIEFLQRLKEQHPKEKLYLLHKEGDQGCLLHETTGETIFKEGHNYEALDHVGSIADGKYVVMNNIAVTDEGRPSFESRFNQRARLIEKEPGFAAIRVLRPLSNDTYIILTAWEEEKSFTDWQASQAYNQAHKKRGTSEGVDKQPAIFLRPSYVTSYHIMH